MRRHKLFWGSSYDRGLPNLLYIWPNILKEIPKAELHICYGWDLFVEGFRNNAERMNWKKEVDTMMQQKGIVHHGRVGKKELQKIRKACGIWAYPTHFTEINCITALECQADGVVPVTMALAALKETVQSGILIEGKIEDKIDEYEKELIGLMKDAKRWNKESEKARKVARKYRWEKIALEWTEEFAKPVDEVSVSVITPTNRTGWWNLMAENLQSQSHPIKEWIIIDDSGTNSKTATHYAKKYGLNIILKKTPKDYQRKYSLTRADNIGWQTATGDLLVWLQDFTTIPTNGIESLVDIYRHNRDALIAPTDIHYSLKGKADFTKPDAFGGRTDIFDEEVFINPRNEFIGLRESENPYDWELNYGAIPRAIVQELNGFYEFMDDEDLGYDNTDLAYRALLLGYRLLIDDTNVASCLRHQDYLEEKPRGNKNQKRYQWLTEQIKKGNIPIIRNEEKYAKNTYNGG